MSLSAETSTPREPEVGEILLFCIDSIEGRRKHRPLLVCSVVDGDRVSGEVFCDFERDSRSAWGDKLFYRLDKTTRHQWVSGVGPGSAVGEWEFRDPQILAAPTPPRLSKIRGQIRPLAEVKGLPR
jgi:hypothetical protein